jgi:hypothetical protein
MQDINLMKEKINALYEGAKPIHVDVHSTRPKINVSCAEARIIGVYKNLFTVEIVENGLKKIFSVPYTDLFIGKVKIRELQ